MNNVRHVNEEVAATSEEETLGTLASARARVPLSREPRTLREEQQRATREKLIHAAFMIFSQKTFNDVTINDIVALAGASRATFYLHFASKSEALAAAWAEVCQPVMHDFWCKLDGLEVWDMPALLDWADAYLSGWESTRNFHLASMQAVAIDASLAERWHQGIDAFLSDAPRILARIAQSGSVPEQRFLLLCNLMERGVNLYFTGHFRGSRAELVHEMAAFWHQTLNAGPAA